MQWLARPVQSSKLSQKSGIGKKKIVSSQVQGMTIMRKILPWVILGSAVILYATNPSKENHYAEITRYMKQQSAAYGQLIYALNEAIGWHEKLIDSLDLQYTSYGIYSITKAGNSKFPLWGADGEIVSIGLLGRVITPEVQQP